MSVAIVVSHSFLIEVFPPAGNGTEPNSELGLKQKKNKNNKNKQKREIQKKKRETK